MPNKESFIFDVNADITKAMQRLNEVKRALDEIDSLRKKGERQGRTTSDKDMINSMRAMKQAAQEYKKMQDLLKNLDKRTKGSNNNMYKNNPEAAQMKQKTGVDLKTKQDYQKFIRQQRRDLDAMYSKVKNAQKDMARFGQTYSKNFQTNYGQKGIMHVDTKNLDNAKQAVTGILDEARNSSKELDNVLNKIREAKKLDRRSESLSRRASASNYMSFQQSSNFTKDMSTSRNVYKQDKSNNLTRLAQISTDITKFSEQIRNIESKPAATVKDMEKRSELQNSIRALDKEWQARTELNKVLEVTTANMERYNQSVQGVTVKPDRGTLKGMAYERAPAIGLALTGAVAAAFSKLYNQGSGLSKEMRENEVAIGQQTGMDGANWRTDIRNNAMNAGLKNKLGFSGQEMLSFQENYLSKRGFTSREDLQAAMTGQATFSRATGINAQDTQQFFETAYRSGGMNGSQTKSFQNAFVGAIKQSGMEGREKDQIKALDGILGGMTQGRSITNQELMQTVGLQTVLSGTGISELGGTKGGQMLSSLDEGIRKGFDDPAVRVAFGQGTKYQGVEGRWKLRQQMEKGISDIDNVNTIAGIAKQFGGGDKEKEYEAFMSFAKERLGVDVTTKQVKGIMDEYNKGNLAQENLSKVMEKNQTEGEKESKKRQSNYEKSSAAVDSQSEAVTAKQAVNLNDMGEVVRKANAALGGLPAPAYAAITALGALTLAFGAAAISFRAASMLRGGLAGKYGGGGGTPPTGGGVSGAGAGKGKPPGGGAAPPGYSSTPGGLLVPNGSSNAPHTAVPGGATRQYSSGTSLLDKVKGFFDPTARAGGLPNPGTGAAITGGAIAGGALVGGAMSGGASGSGASGSGSGASGSGASGSGGSKAGKFSSLFKGGLKDSVAFKGLNKIMLPLAIFSAGSTIMSAESKDKGKATGSATGGIVGSIIGSAGAGAAAGSFFPGIGNIAGGLVGLAGGLIGAFGGSKLGEKIGGWFDGDKKEEKKKKATNSTESQVDKENTNTKQRTEGKKTDNLANEKENINMYAKTLDRADSLLAQARSQNGIMGTAMGGTAMAGGANGVNGFTGGGSLKFLPEGQKWSNNNVTQHDLGTTDAKLTAEDLDAWINSKAPKDSMMRGMGATFLKAGQETGLDPRYLIAHAAEESAWGTSRIAREKGNFFGIGAFDNSPYASAYEFKDGSGSAAEKGIMGGAKWIADKYYGKGNTTLDKMHKAGYATNADWASNIANIMKGSPTGSGSGNVTATINVNVKGDEKVSDKIKNSSDMKKVGSNLADMLGFYSKEMVMV